MTRHHLVRWIEPAFPVLLVAAGVLLAPALFLTGADANDAALSSEKNRFAATPVWWQDRYAGCAFGEHVYAPEIVPPWRCGLETTDVATRRDVASVPDAGTPLGDSSLR